MCQGTLDTVEKGLGPFTPATAQIRASSVHLAANENFYLCHSPAQLTSFAPPLEPQHVNAPLLRVVVAEYYLHPSLYGPFLLELSDPLSREVVEWDKPWLLFPSWNVRAHNYRN